MIAHLRNYIQNPIQCFIRYPDTPKSVLKSSAAFLFFNQLLVVWILDETLRVVLDILLLTCPNYMSSIRQGFQARILLFSSLARSPRYINLTDFELLPICYKSVFVVNIYKYLIFVYFLYTNICI